jgi:hypothetical protein
VINTFEAKIKSSLNADAGVDTTLEIEAKKTNLNPTTAKPSPPTNPPSAGGGFFGRRSSTRQPATTGVEHDAIPPPFPGRELSDPSRAAYLAKRRAAILKAKQMQLKQFKPGAAPANPEVGLKANLGQKLGPSWSAQSRFYIGRN